MAHITETFITACRPADVWAVIADFSQTAHWDPGVSSATRHTTGPLSEGDRYTVWVRAGLARLRFRYRTRLLLPRERVMFEGVGTTVRVLDDIRITETSDGTQVTWNLELALRGPLDLFSPLVATAFRPAAASAIRGLQRYLDAHDSSAA